MSNLAIQEAINSRFQAFREGSIVEGKVIDVRSQVAVVGIGYKSEGAIPLVEFQGDVPNKGDKIDVLLERLENEEGILLLSRQKAVHKQNWDKILEAYQNGDLVKGKVTGEIKGGLVIDIGIEAFLPTSQVDVIPLKDLRHYIGEYFNLKVVKLDRTRRNAVVSRREIIEQERAEMRKTFLSSVKQGDKVTGMVKNITDFGAFIDFNGVDGLLHITDMSWKHISHPSETVSIGQSLDLQVLEVDLEKERFSLGLKQMTPNPWNEVEKKYPIGSKVKGKITRLVAYGAFLQIEDGVEGLIHVSEFSWVKRVSHPGNVLKLGDEVEALVLAISKEEQKISLSPRQLVSNPWEEMDKKYPIGSKVRVKILSLTSYGAFVDAGDDIEAMIHVSDISWTRKINHPGEILKKGEEIEVAVLNVDKQNQRISLGIKQLEVDPWDKIEEKFQIGKEVSGRVAKIINFGAFVELEDDIDGLVHISQISEEHVERVKDVLKVGDEVKARVIKINKPNRRIGLSIKAFKYNEEEFKKEVQSYESIQSGDDLVGLEQAFNLATSSQKSEEWTPSGSTNSEKQDS